MRKQFGRKRIGNFLIALPAAAAVMIALSGTAGATAYTLLNVYQRSRSGTLSSLDFKAGAAQGCPNSGANYIQPCYNPANAFISAQGVITAVVSAGQPTWDWDGTTLTGSGLLWATGFIGSGPVAAVVIGDEVHDLVIDTGTPSATATTYICHEGNFLQAVNANGCFNIDLGTNNTLDSSGAYNVGGDATCMVRTIGGDDISTADPRGLTTRAAGGGCNATDGAFVQYTVWKDAGGVLVLSDAADIGPCPFYGPASFSSPCAADLTYANINYLVFVSASATDTDGDGMPDAIDNCSNVSNGDQFDGDSDGYGNICDGDFIGPAPGNGTTNVQDYAYFRTHLGTADPDADLIHNGTVNAQDYARFRTLLGLPPGPSGLHP